VHLRHPNDTFEEPWFTSNARRAVVDVNIESGRPESGTKGAYEAIDDAEPRAVARVLDEGS
jgi:hypothetical protein